MATKKSVQGFELEINDLRSEYARTLKAIKEEADRTIAELRSQLAQRSEERPGDAARSEIVGVLTDAGGPLTVAQIKDRCKGATKSKIHTHLNKLEKRGEVWLRKTHDPVNGRPCTMVYLASSVRAS